jgi:hypothetical protein
MCYVSTPCPVDFTAEQELKTKREIGESAELSREQATEAEVRVFKLYSIQFNLRTLKVASQCSNADSFNMNSMKKF